MKEKKNSEKINYEQTELSFGNESFGIPSDCTQKQKMNGFKLVCYIVVVLLVCSAVYGSYRAATSYFLPVMTFDKSSQPLLYIKNSEVMLKAKGERTGKAVVSSDRYNTSDTERLVQMTEDGRRVFYASDGDGDELGFDLYFCRVSDIDEENGAVNDAVCIDKGVTEFKIQPDGQFVLYLRGSRLYCSDLTDSHLVALNVTEFYLSKNNQQIVYFKDGGKMYTCGTGKKDAPVLIDTDIDKLLSEKNEYVRIYYLKQGALYLKEAGKKKICLAENVKDGILLGDYVYFVKEEERPTQLRELFFDDVQIGGTSPAEPLKSDYLRMNAAGEAVFDEAAYNEALERYEEAVTLEAVQNYFLLNPVTENVNVLYTVKRGELKEVDSGLTDGYLAYSSCKQAIVYKKKSETHEKIKLSSVESIEDALEKIEKYLTNESEEGLYVLVKDKMPFLGIEHYPEGQIEISLDKKFLYCIEDIGDDGRGTLVRYSLSAKELKNRKELCEGVTDFALDGADATVVMVFDGNRLGMCFDETYTHLSDSSCHSFFYVDGTLFFFDDYDYDSQSGRLKTFRDGKVKLVDTGVYKFDAINLKTVAYIKHFNQEFGIGDLYVKTGNKKGKKVDICVRSILH